MVATLFVGCGDSNNGPSDPATILAETCSNGSKIIAGTSCPGVEGTVGRLDLFDEEDNLGRCTAILISDRKAVTAAHCFDEFIFRANMVVLGETRAVSRVVPHPQARPVGDRFENDCAVIELAEPLSFTPPTPTLASTPSAGDPLLVFGYGRVTPGDSPSTLPTTPVGGEMLVTGVGEQFIESLYDGSSSNTCRGDSGGPAMTIDQDGKLQLAGLVSFGTLESCAVGDVSNFSNLTAPWATEFLQREAPELFQ